MAHAIERPEDCLIGGGRMGALMRAMDWSATGLGPVSSWPQSLRTAVSICLNSRFPILIWWGPDFIKLYNDAYSEIISGKHPRALGQRGRDCWPEIWDIIGPMLAGVIERGEATWSENQYLPLERLGYPEECYFTFAYSPIRDESGGVGGVFSVVSETTREILAQRRLAALTRVSAVVSPDEERCWSEVAHALEGVTDVPFAMLYRRREAHDGYELAASTNASLAPSAPARASRDELDALAQAPGRCVLLAIGRAGAAPYGYLLAGLNPQRPLDADYRSFLELLADHAGNAIGTSRALDEERRRAEALARLDQAKTVFFSNVSHEFRTPLALILAPLEDLIAGANGPLAPAQLEKAQLMRRNALRLQKLVNTLLDFSRIEAGRARARFVATDLGAFTADLASTFRSAFERASLEFRIDIAPGLEPAFVDREMWEKIVLNLLSNALKFTFEGCVTLTLTQSEGAFELTVADTGVGIAADHVPLLFERFRRIEGTRSRSHEGSGIGLALVQELARLHGGRVEVASRAGEGTAFTVTIPRGSAHLPADQVEASSPLAKPTPGVQAFVEEALRWSPHSELLEAIRAGEAAEAPAPAARERVLLADDNADMREYVEALLSSRYEVEVATNGAEALAACEASPPDLVVSDLMMPVMDGIALVRALRSRPRTRGIPVILVSARADDESRIEALTAGAQDYLYKPFRAQELLNRVAARLEVARLQSTLEREREWLVGLFAQAPIPIAVLRGDDLVFELANPAYEALLRHGTLAGRRLLDVLPELAAQNYEKRLHDVMRSGVAYVAREEHVVLMRDGALEDTYFDFIYAPMRDAAGRSEAVIVMASEVTSRVAARPPRVQSEDAPVA